MNSVPVDYMHCILLGVMKRLVTLWFDKSNSKQPWYVYRITWLVYILEAIFCLMIITFKLNVDRYIGRRLETVDVRLCEIKPPCCLSRLPRALKERKFWKGICTCA